MYNGASGDKMEIIQFPKHTDCIDSDNYGYLYVMSKGIGIGNIGVKAYLEVHECGVDYDGTGPSYTPFSDVSYFELKGEDLRAFISNNKDAINHCFYGHFLRSRRISYDEFLIATSSEKSKDNGSLHDTDQEMERQTYLEEHGSNNNNIGGRSR